jgi:hypothetical protein
VSAPSNPGLLCRAAATVLVVLRRMALGDGLAAYGCFENCSPPLERREETAATVPHGGRQMGIEQHP